MAVHNLHYWLLKLLASQNAQDVHREKFPPYPKGDKQSHKTTALSGVASSLTAAAQQQWFPSANVNRTSEQVSNYSIWRKPKQQSGLFLTFSIDAGKHQNVDLAGAVFPERNIRFLQVEVQKYTLQT